MYRKSLVVFAMCTLFVLAFLVVLNYEAGAISSSTSADFGNQGSQCAGSTAPCEHLAMISPALYEENYSSSLLGPGGYARLIFGLNVTGPSAVTSLRIYVDNISAGTLQGPFEPGIVREVNATLPATVTVSAGSTYILSVEGEYGNAQGVWATSEITAN